MRMLILLACQMRGYSKECKREKNRSQSMHRSFEHCFVSKDSPALGDGDNEDDDETEEVGSR